MPDRLMTVRRGNRSLGGAEHLVLGVGLPGAFVDLVGAALQQAPDGAPPRDIIGAHLARLSQRVAQSERRRTDDDERGRKSQRIRTCQLLRIFIHMLI